MFSKNQVVNVGFYLHQIDSARLTRDRKASLLTGLKHNSAYFFKNFRLNYEVIIHHPPHSQVSSVVQPSLCTRSRAV